MEEEGSNNTPIHPSGGNKWLSNSQVDEHNILPEKSDLNYFVDVDDNSQDQSLSDSERERREELRQSFIALAALVPGGLKQGSSILGETIKYVKDLKERVAVLEEECNNNNKKPKRIINGEDDEESSSWSWSCNEIENERSRNEPILRVDAKKSGQEVLLRIVHCCKRQDDIMLKILTHVQTLHLFVLKTSLLRFGDSVAITIIAQIGEGYNMTLKDLEKTVRTTTLKCFSS